MSRIILFLRWLRERIDKLLRALGDEDVHTMNG